MYGSVAEQIVHLSHYALALIGLFWIWPLVTFRTTEDRDRLERFWARFAQAVCLIIALGYFLAAIKLFELVSMLIMALVVSAGLNIRRGVDPSKLVHRIATRCYDLLDGMIPSWPLFAKRSSRWTARGWRLRSWTGESVKDWVLFFILVMVLLHSAYLRLADAFRHAAPAMSDAYVTLAWMKYIENRILFHDGIYPQGFHVVLSTIRKFAAIDALYVLKYTGPLNGVLATLGVYLTTSRWTKCKSAGLIACFFYGILGSQLHFEWERQASTNSQEFALVFLAVAWYFAVRYLEDGKRDSLWVLLACLAVIGWVHTLVYAFVAAGIALLFISHLLVHRGAGVKRSLGLVGVGVASGILSALPLALGLLSGKQFHSSSVEYLTLHLDVGLTPLTPFDWAALVGVVLFFISLAWRSRTPGEFQIALFVLLLGAGTCGAYLFLGPLTGNAVLVSRLGVMWGTVMAISLGAGWAALISALARFRSPAMVEALLTGAVLAGALFYYHPQPAVPYKMQYDSTVEQYLRINAEFRPTQWTMVSEEEGYALVLGRGWHIQLQDFLEWYDPNQVELGRMVDGQWQAFLMEDIFIVAEKKVFWVDMEIMQPILERRVQDYQRLENWVASYRQSHDDLSVFYEDEDICIYRIHQSLTHESKLSGGMNGKLIPQ